MRHTLWVASCGLPGPARSLMAALGEIGPDDDAVVQLALLAESAEGFLDIDTGLVRLLESALQRVTEPGLQARLLARLSRALLGDAATADRRRALVRDALALGRRSGDPAVLAEVLDARLLARALGKPLSPHRGQHLVGGLELPACSLSCKAV